MTTKKNPLCHAKTVREQRVESDILALEIPGYKAIRISGGCNLINVVDVPLYDPASSQFVIKSVFSARQQDELRCVAKSSHHIISAIADTERGLYGVQFHVFTENGRKMLHNFLFDLWIVRRFHIGETQAAMYRLQPMYSRT
ncbi:hypothetical protein GHT06_009688 [Daphnia sinensis]|uniref:Uncharacterized protein n=1 Tax=Daphnia sinensis TaxID=1820382 RepID=A0AAD5Q3X1_9CRUS|nr:hypothetical protein GHT06_009688 [Daphnia sinensis]